MSTTPPLLDYGQRPRGLRRRRVRRVILVVLPILVCAAAYHWWTPVSAKIRMLYWQRECMNYSPPPDFVVFEQDPREGQKLIEKNPRYEVSTRLDKCVRFYPRAWFVFWDAQGSGFSAEPPVFLHRLRSRNGEERLVALFVSRRYRDSGSELLFANVFKPGTLRSDPQYVATTGVLKPEEMALLIAVAPGETLRLFAGQPDPNDSAHFTIDYMLSGRRGTIDGRLADTGDVLYTPRGGRFLRWNSPFPAMARWWYPPESSHVPQPAETPVDPKRWNTTPASTPRS